MMPHSDAALHFFDNINICVSFIESHLLLELIKQLKRRGGGKIFKAFPTPKLMPLF